MSLVYHNGRIVDGAIGVDPRERGLLLGDGLFETMLVVKGEALWRNLHLARMEGGANELGIAFDRQAADGAVDTLLARADGGHHVLRLSGYRQVDAGARTHLHAQGLGWQGPQQPRADPQPWQ